MGINCDSSVAFAVSRLAFGVARDFLGGLALLVLRLFRGPCDLVFGPAAFFECALLRKNSCTTTKRGSNLTTILES